MKYSYCETVTASSHSDWHLRPLTEKGQKFGGGADTKSLCGRDVACDLHPVVDLHNIQSNACKKCVAALLAV